MQINFNKMINTTTHLHEAKEACQETGHFIHSHVNLFFPKSIIINFYYNTYI